MGSYFLMVKAPVSVAMNESFSEEPAVVDWMEKDPENFKVPETPRYFPVPESTLAVPLTSTTVGAAWPTAQA